MIGGGHAGCEAYAAATRIGARASLVTLSQSRIACQPCNPAVGGPAKGHLVREVVALGGLMGLATDRSGLQFRTLNIRKGPAVRATRVQTDSELYVQEMSALVRGLTGGTIIEDRVVGFAWTGSGQERRVIGVHLERGGELRARAVVVAAGTFLRGMLHIGSEQTPGGRRGEAPAVRLARSLEEAGLPLLRLKTGTCPRLDASTIDFEGLDAQKGDEPPPFFDPRTREHVLPQRACHVTYTGEETHTVILENLSRSALYGGAITGIGPRYCPSIETKVARFKDKDRHQIFLEPE
ncbi:MAG: FAD-dependent oxidoreductase, partial [Deltaproteobacteria bacterium]|nr:FAD-dependent oxidoreductase [Deltaproteobacteria bacterium]